MSSDNNDRVVDVVVTAESDHYDYGDERWLTQVADLRADLRREVVGFRVESTRTTGTNGAVEAMILSLGSALLAAFPARHPGGRPGRPHRLRAPGRVPGIGCGQPGLLNAAGDSRRERIRHDGRNQADLRDVTADRGRAAGQPRMPPSRRVTAASTM
jgi:hypothetical protein